MKLKHYIYMLLVTALPVLCGCNNEDDVVEIFTGKTWKLSKISAEGMPTEMLSSKVWIC